MDDIIDRLKDQSLQLAQRSFDSVDAGLAANVADAAIDEIERLREELLKRHAQRRQDPEACPYAIDGCVLENQEIGSCLCALTSTYGVAPADRIEAAAKIIWPGGFDKESGSEAQRHEAREKAKRVLALTSTERTRPFYGAECPSYPVCEGGCGLGCTKEIERPLAPAISHPPENIEPGA